MLLCFLCFSQSKISKIANKSNIWSKIELENAPSFDEGMDDARPEDDIYSNSETTLNQVTYMSQSREYSFFKCQITVNGNSVFSDNFAFGSGKGSGNGGVFYITDSVLIISDYNRPETVVFNNNQAAVGGAISSLTSAFLFYNCKFESNEAYKFGGAIYFQGTYVTNENGREGYVPAQVTMLGHNNLFRYNKATELGGAIAISICLEIYFEKTKFFQNQCCFGGGAISAANVDDLKLVYCYFAYNTVDASNELIYQATTRARTQESLTSNFPETILSNFGNTKIPTHFKGRGGGAIVFISDAKKGSLPTGENTHKHRIFNSQYCCYYGDSSIQTGQSFGHGAGNEILLEGYAKLISYHDYIFGFNNEDWYSGAISQSVSRVLRNWPGNSSGWQVYELLGGNESVLIQEPAASQCSPIISSTEAGQSEHNPTTEISKPQTSNEYNFSFAPGINTGNGKTSFVPTPSLFTYQRTPQSRIPFATTKSHFSIKYPDIVITFDTNKASFVYSKLISLPGFNQFTNIPDMPPSTMKATPMETPSRTAYPNGYTPVSPGYGMEYNSTISVVISYISSESFLKKGEEYWDGSTFRTAPTDGKYSGAWYTTIETVILYNPTAAKIDEMKPRKSKQSNLLLIIGIAAGAILLLLFIGLIIFFVLRREKDEEESQPSIVEMNEETYIISDELDSTTPIFTMTSSLFNEDKTLSDDPFKDDFEEEMKFHFFGLNTRGTIAD